MVNFQGGIIYFTGDSLTQNRNLDISNSSFTSIKASGRYGGLFSIYSNMYSNVSFVECEFNDSFNVNSTVNGGYIYVESAPAYFKVDMFLLLIFFFFNL